MVNIIYIRMLFIIVYFSSNLVSGGVPPSYTHDLNDEVNDCKWRKRGKLNITHSPEVYYINLDKSIQRRINIEKHLKQLQLTYYRIRGLEPKDIFIPKDVEQTKLRNCLMETSWRPPVVSSTTDTVLPSSITSTASNIDATESASIQQYSTSINNGTVSERRYVVSALCGRRKNNLKEIGCTTSHLLAIHQAVYSTTATSRYALILEDDIFIPFNIDFELLAKSAPVGFGILQLFNSNEMSMNQTWKKYVRHIDQLRESDGNGGNSDSKSNISNKSSTGNTVDGHHSTNNINNDNGRNVNTNSISSSNDKLWIQHNPNRFSYWSTCAYLIDRHVMKSIIDTLVTVTSSSVNNSGDVTTNSSIANHLSSSVKDGIAGRYIHASGSNFDSTVDNNTTATEWMQFKLIAGYLNPCTPSQCCISSNSNSGSIHNNNVSSSNSDSSGSIGNNIDISSAVKTVNSNEIVSKSQANNNDNNNNNRRTKSTDSSIFNQTPPLSACVYAPRGYQADSFIYATTTTYVLSIPLITNGMGGNQSTFHQFHVEVNHKKAFQTQRYFINQLLSGQVPTPSFATPACHSLDINYI